MCVKCSKTSSYRRDMCVSCYRAFLLLNRDETYTCSECGGNIHSSNDSKLCRKCYHYQYMNNYIKTANNKIKIQARNSKYKKNNRAKISEAQREREKFDINFALKRRLRHRMYMAIKNKNDASAVRDLGCSIEEFKLYLESKFQPDMSWDNYGLYGWHIDHIVPLANFDLTDPEQFKKACHYTNLQPLWAQDNLQKGDKL